jgi:membrane protein required for colicin V production
MLTIYVAVSLGVYFVAWLIRATLRKLKFEAYDRHLGMLLGGAEGALLGIVATVFVVSLAPDAREPILTSPSGRVVNRLLAAVQPTLPGELRKVLTPFWDDPSGAPVEHRLADLDEPGTRRLDEIPADSTTALDWLQRQLPGSAEPEVAPPADRTVDPALVRSAFELGAQQLRDRTRTSDADRSGPPAGRDAGRQPYWWEEDAHGRDAGHR